MFYKCYTREYMVDRILLAGNRGPCGGVNMARDAADQVLNIADGREKVYSNWDIVNNRPLVERLTSRGLVSVRNNWDLVPDNSIVLFSAHGVPPAFHEIAERKKYCVIDVTCPLVTRVHNLAIRSETQGKHVVYIGVNGHPETVGVLGELNPTNSTLIENEEDVLNTHLPEGKPAVVYSQTTLSTAEIKGIMKALKLKYQGIDIPNRWDICYATDNRQSAVEKLLPIVEGLLVVGSPHSHNSQELRKMGAAKGLPSFSVDYPSDIDKQWFGPKVRNLGVTSGASVMDEYLGPVVEWFEAVNPELKVSFMDQVIPEKDMTFRLPAKDIQRLQSRYA